MRVVMYSTPTCVACKSAQKFLDENEIAYKTRDISKDTVAAERILEATRQIGVPVFEVINGGPSEWIVGFDKKKLSKMIE